MDIPNITFTSVRKLTENIWNRSTVGLQQTGCPQNVPNCPRVGFQQTNRSNGRQRINKISYLIFLMLCCLGAIWQIISISQVYFEYDTTISIKETDELNIPAISLCNFH